MLVTSQRLKFNADESGSPRDIRIELARALFDGTPAMLAICAAVLISAIGIGFHLDDPVFFWIAACSLVTLTSRTGIYVAFKRFAAVSLTAVAADRWTRVYGVVSIAFSCVLSILIAYGFRHGDSGSIFVIGDLIVLYAAQSARVSIRPWIGLSSGFVLSLALMTGVALNDSPILWGLAALLSLSYLAFVKSVLVYQRSTVQRMNAQRNVEYMARHDGLTGLFNRAHFSVLLDDKIKRTIEKKGRLAIHFIDLDHFKAVNDTHGHKRGDELLCALASRLMTECRSLGPDACIVSRIGGDEFIVAQADVASDVGAAAFAEQLRHALTEVGGPIGVVTASIGMAVFPDDASTAEDLVRNADAALHEAKAAGRATFRGFDAATAERLHEHKVLTQDLRAAVSGNTLSVVYQPQVRTEDAEILGFEALLRWNHPRFGPIPPSRFIPIAEEDGTIAALGLWVLETACREASSWIQPLCIAVNLSPAQIMAGDLAPLVQGILARTGLEPHRLELEITEGIFIDDPAGALQTLNALKALGVRIAMDDFGTGYSSLSYLQSFPFDRIKIDRSFIFNIEVSRHSLAIVRAVTSLGNSLNVPVMAEGVETETQRNLLLREGCGEIQGYLFGRPEPIETYDVVTGKRRGVRSNAA